MIKRPIEDSEQTCKKVRKGASSSDDRDGCERQVTNGQSSIEANKERSISDTNEERSLPGVNEERSSNGTNEDRSFFGASEESVPVEDRSSPGACEDRTTNNEIKVEYYSPDEIFCSETLRDMAGSENFDLARSFCHSRYDDASNSFKNLWFLSNAGAVQLYRFGVKYVIKNRENEEYHCVSYKIKGENNCNTNYGHTERILMRDILFDLISNGDEDIDKKLKDDFEGTDRDLIKVTDEANKYRKYLEEKNLTVKMWSERPPCKKDEGGDCERFINEIFPQGSSYGYIVKDYDPNEDRMLSEEKVKKAFMDFIEAYKTFTANTEILEISYPAALSHQAEETNDRLVGDGLREDADDVIDATYRDGNFLADVGTWTTSTSLQHLQDSYHHVPGINNVRAPRPRYTPLSDLQLCVWYPVARLHRCNTRYGEEIEATIEGFSDDCIDRFVYLTKDYNSRISDDDINSYNDGESPRISLRYMGKGIGIELEFQSP